MGVCAMRESVYAGNCIRFVRLISQKCIIPAQNFGFMPSELLLDMMYSFVC